MITHGWSRCSIGEDDENASVVEEIVPTLLGGWYKLSSDPTVKSIEL